MTTLFISHSSKDKAWAERMLRVLSDSGYQSLFIDSHPDYGIPVGTDWERTLYQVFRRSLGVVVLCSANWLASPWCVAEALIARQRGRPVFMLATPDAAPQIPLFLRDRQFINLAGVSEKTAYQLLLQGLEKQGLKKKDFKLPDRPYPGLKPFTEDDGAIFFGRDEEIDRVIDVLHNHRKGYANGFLVILGASGCGKSSLVRAGVLPQLRRAGEKDAEAEWVIVPSFFGHQGLEGLTFKLETAFYKAGKRQGPDTISEKLEAAYEQTGGMERAVKALLELAMDLLLACGLPNGHVLLVLDQLEEVFATAEGSDAHAMLRLLLVASAHPASRVVVLATMRSDFLEAFQKFEGAADRYEEITLDPMLRSHFSEVIERPADRFGLDLDPGLSERMAADTAYNDALPLLAFTLDKLYENSKAQDRLTLEAYDELGGVLAPIKYFADKVLRDTGYAGLPADDPRMRDLRRAFYSLARVSEEGQFSGRSAEWSRMPASCEKVLQYFVSQRLLVSDTANGGEPVLRVAHEALFRVWDTLRDWLREDRKALALRNQIEDAAAEWEGQERAASRTWAEERVLDAVHVIEVSGVSLADVGDLATVDAFLGPTDPEILEALPVLSEGEDARAGSGRYGVFWRLPLGHVARASVGVRLALLGDRRKGVGLRADGLPDIDWRLIESGEVTIEIRADPFNPNSELVQTLRRVVAPFRIARYPVTVIQFQAFLQNCQRNGKLKLPRGFPLDLYDYQPPRHWARYSNYPADSVNWYDAAAFCHWLSARLGFLVRLPTEAEWQFAATGGESVKSWPWGPNWDPLQEPWRANTVESELSRPSAVGLYPLGASSAGALDMAGTVWEWCRNAFNDPDNIGFPMNSSDRRTRRGGSWADDRDSARCAGRVGSGPDFRSGNIGFRPVSPILDC